MGCCEVLRPDDGHIDRVAVERAMNGDTVRLSRSERKMLIWRLATERRWGLDRISQHLGYSRSSVAEILASARQR